VFDADTAGYAVPAGNPFVSGGPSRPGRCVWSFGLRNPWRYTFDDPHGGTGALVIGDGPESLRRDRLRTGEPGRAQLRWRNREGARQRHVAAGGHQPLT
jgi:hypothetical protein